MNVKPFPFFGSYSSRLFAESWESSNLYWARLADDMGYSPAALNSLVPGLTRRMISNIFATDIEDWPAVLRALRQTGEEFRQGKIAGMPPANSGSHVATVAANGSRRKAGIRLRRAAIPSVMAAMPIVPANES